jgi:hypothetical protein
MSASIYFYSKSEACKLHKHSAYGLQYTCSNTAKPASFCTLLASWPFVQNAYLYYQKFLGLHIANPQIHGLIPLSQTRKFLGCVRLLIAIQQLFLK